MSSAKNIQRVRRIVQAAFTLFFLWLLISTFYHGIVEEDGVISESLPYPVSFFLHIDPLAALSTFMATGTVYSGFLISLWVIIPTLFLGRWFCGWVCPFGAINHLFSWFSRMTAGRRVKRNRYGKHQAVKYVLLLFFLGSALAGTMLVGLMDPICFLIRGLGLSILPVVDMAARFGIDFLPQGSSFHEGLHRFLDVGFLGPGSVSFHGGWLVGGAFILVVGLNFFMTRFWCRVLCPLGALLGVLSRFSVFGLEKKEGKCTDCSLCTASCQGGASPEHGPKWKGTECILCHNCVSVCPEDAIAFGFGVHPETTESKVDLSRRGFVTSFALGAAAYPLLRLSHDAGVTPDPLAIRPPGSRKEKEFLERCIKCGQCMKACPNNAIHPASFQAGFEGFWSPVIIPKLGYCEPTCTLCSEVCPTGAIRAFTAEDKKENRVKIGTAFFDRGRCLPWAMGRTCLQCEEFCPTSPKAIWFEDSEALQQDGSFAPVKLPRVDPVACNGCGACENVCPLADRSAVRVTSAGESRSLVNRFILEEDGTPP